LDLFHQFLRVDFPSEILNVVGPEAGVSAVVVESTRIRRQRQEEQEHGREERLKKKVFIITVR
jgi:mRNA degradation ribonuclease J1/J2|tara:strand:+ start:1686 stop:1874 length:189 start_codon:yes stop_codon:yes gene_type:complete